LESCRQDEVACLKRLVPFIKECSRKLWLVSVVTKQDLWRPDEATAGSWYRSGEYGNLIRDIANHKGTTFKHEFHLLSLVIGNFVSAKDETLANNVKGYDQRTQIESVRRLFEIIDGVRTWVSQR